MAADKQDTQDEITVVGPGADEEQEGAPAEGAHEPRAGDDYQYAEGEDDGDERATRGGGDERTGHAEEEPEGGDETLSREQKRRRRKREKYDRDQRELAFLRSRNEQLERQRSQELARIESRQTQSDVLAIDGRISQAEADVREAETLLQQAMDAKDSAAAVEALRVRDQLRDGLQQLRGAKHQTVRAAQERAAAATSPAAPDPAVAARVQEWMRERPWFDPQLRNEDSAVAYAVEQAVFREGRLSPRSDAYWEEVDRRLAKRLPEHYGARGEDDDEDDEGGDTRAPRTQARERQVTGTGKEGTTRRPTGPTIKVGGRERTLRKGEVYIDEDRKQAMIEKGVWDDPVLRDRQLKYYQTYDREAGRRPR